MDQLSETQIQNYTLIQKLGEGACSQVMLAKRNLTKTLSALKMIPKPSQFNQNQLNSILLERQLLSDISHPFIVKMDQAFQTRTHFCLVLEYCPGGDLYNHLHSCQIFSEKKIALYAAQLILALEHLHAQNIIFKDLKPQNILIGKDGYLKLTDFGLSSKSDAPADQIENSTFCGTFEYTSPEIIKGNESGKAFDWWTLGCCLYEILYQVSPFYSDDKNQLKENISSKDPVFLGKTSSALKDLIRKLLAKNPIERLEFIENIKSHRFFEGISFEKLLSKQIPMPYIPDYIRGKKMLKVIREDVEAFTKLSDQKTPEESYVWGFDYNYEGLEQQAIASQDDKSDQKNQKTSTEDDDDETYKNAAFELDKQTNGKKLPKLKETLSS